MRPAGAPWVRIAVLAMLGCVACAGRHPGNRFITKSETGPVEVLERPWPVTTAPSADAFRNAVAAARAARPEPSVPVTIESHAGELRDALASLRSSPTAAGHVRVALAYRDAGVLDQALEQFDAALKQNFRLAAAYDGRARIWRDWGLPALGMGDASRAVFHAPRSASARNTLGTLLDATGDCVGARAAYGRALTLDPTAAYARTNLQRLEERLGRGAERCGPSPAKQAPVPQDRARR